MISLKNSSRSFEQQLSHTELEYLSIVFACTATLSLVGSWSVIVIAIKRKIVKRRNVLPLFHIFVADLLASLGILIGASSNSTVVDEQTNGIKDNFRAYCIVITIFTTACYMVTFLLTINYALQSYITLSERLENPHSPVIERMLRCCNIERYFPIFSWILPFGLAVFIIFVDPSKTTHVDDDICTWCFPLYFYENAVKCNVDPEDPPKKKSNFYYMYKLIFLILMTLTLLLVTILFYFVFKLFRRLLLSGGVVGRAQYEQVKTIRNRTLLLFSVLAFCWLIPIALGFISLDSTFVMTHYFWLYILEAVTSPLQGFLNCIVYGWFSIRFQRSTTRDESELLDPCSSPMPSTESDNSYNQ